jgi:hypothetical protein
VYRDYFNEFKTVVQDYGIVQGDVYNMNKTGFRIGVGGSQWIITMEFKKPQLLKPLLLQSHNVQL